MKTEQIKYVRDTFQSILRADYISISDVEQLKALDDYYVDFFKILPKILQNQDSYVNGRRGTGKTSLLMRAYYECMKTISPSIKDESCILQNKKVLPVYIDLSQCKEMFSQESDEHLEHNFIIKIVDEIRTQLETIFQDNRLRIAKKDYSKLDDFENFLETIKAGIVLKSSKKNISEIQTQGSSEKVLGEISIINANVSGGKEALGENKVSYELEEIRGYNVQHFLGCLGKIRRKSGLDAIYIFVDEFSDLSEAEQEKMAMLLKKLLGSKKQCFL